MWDSTKTSHKTQFKEFENKNTYTIYVYYEVYSSNCYYYYNYKEMNIQQIMKEHKAVIKNAKNVITKEIPNRVFVVVYK